MISLPRASSPSLVMTPKNGHQRGSSSPEQESRILTQLLFPPSNRWPRSFCCMRWNRIVLLHARVLSIYAHILSSRAVLISLIIHLGQSTMLSRRTRPISHRECSYWFRELNEQVETSLMTPKIKLTNTTISTAFSIPPNVPNASAPPVVSSSGPLL